MCARTDACKNTAVVVWIECSISALQSMYENYTSRSCAPTALPQASPFGRTSWPSGGRCHPGCRGGRVGTYLFIAHLAATQNHGNHKPSAAKPFKHLLNQTCDRRHRCRGLFPADWSHLPRAQGSEHVVWPMQTLGGGEVHRSGRVDKQMRCEATMSPQIAKRRTGVVGQWLPCDVKPHGTGQATCQRRGALTRRCKYVGACSNSAGNAQCFVSAHCSLGVGGPPAVATPGRPAADAGQEPAALQRWSQTFTANVYMYTCT